MTKDRFGPRPTFAYLSTDLLDTDSRYQRALNSDRSRRLIRDIGDNFSWAAFGSVMVVSAGFGRFLIVDGQHRTEGAKLAGVLEVPCIIIAAASLEEQAEAFVRANQKRVTIHDYALHHAAVASGQPGAMDVARVCKIAGLEIPRYPVPASLLKPGQTMAIGTVRKLTVRLGVPAAGALLKAIADAWRHHPGHIRASLLKAAGDLVDVTPIEERPFLYVSLTSYLRRTDPSDLFAGAITMKLQRKITEARAITIIVRNVLDRAAERAA